MDFGFSESEFSSENPDSLSTVFYPIGENSYFQISKKNERQFGQLSQQSVRTGGAEAKRPQRSLGSKEPFQVRFTVVAYGRKHCWAGMTNEMWFHCTNACTLLKVMV